MRAARGLARVQRAGRGALGVVQALLPVHAHRRRARAPHALPRALPLRRPEETGGPRRVQRGGRHGSTQLLGR